MTRTRVVLFDAGGTLFRERTSRAAIYADSARRHGLAVTDAAIAAAMEASHAALPSVVAGEFRYSPAWFRRFIADVFARVGHARLPPGLAPELFDRFADAATFRRFDDVVPALDALARRGCRLAVVSNWSAALPELLERLGIARRFDFVLASAAERVEKPDAGLFLRALERAGVEAAAALHVGDQPARDVAGALAAGIAPVLLDRDGAHARFPGVRIASLLELPELLRGA